MKTNEPKSSKRCTHCGTIVRYVVTGSGMNSAGGPIGYWTHNATGIIECGSLSVGEPTFHGQSEPSFIGYGTEASPKR